MPGRAATTSRPPPSTSRPRRSAGAVGGTGGVVAVGLDEAGGGRAGGGAENGGRAVLTLADEIEPADRQLGELLRSLELIDVDTLQALLLEARRQRRSLRQLLL